MTELKTASPDLARNCQIVLSKLNGIVVRASLKTVRLFNNDSPDTLRCAAARRRVSHKYLEEITCPFIESA